MKDKKSVIGSIALPVRFFASKAFLIWMIGGWIGYYVLSAIWLREAFAAFVAGLHESPFMKVPFLLFLVSGYLNVVRAFRDVFRKSRMHFIAWIVLSVGALLFFTGFFMSSTMRDSGQRIVGEGDMIVPPWGKDSYRIIRIDAGLKDRIASIDTASDIFAHEPKLTVMDKDSRTYEIGAFPPAKFNNTYYHILNFGIAPGVRLFEGNHIKSEGHMILRIITPGSSDFFEVPPYPYRYLVSMEPEKTVQQGQMKTSQFNLKDPVFNVRVFQGEKIVAEGDPGKGITMDNMTLYFFKPTFWVLLEAVKDPGVPVMHSGILFISFGIPFYLVILIFNLFLKQES